ncbi:hypothetical protein B0T16DRAFT_384259 [Cercophora newfieldiana]|uniref:Uncharacterized protein n=1 Tax=Cercophora newfieldiana TaxID=92897 RepID=A0AA39YPG1_9PEZI|nr:hypothetical protein B0T16DRAFT_384259 [Cercophora newfieldiana]
MSSRKPWGGWRRLSLKGAGDKYVQAIIADRDAFKKLAGSHFGTLRSKTAGDDTTKAAIDAADAAFNDLVGGAQVLHQAVVEYSRLVLAFTKSERANEEAQDALASPQAQGGQPARGPGARHPARVMRLMFNAVKAYNAALLKRYTVLDSLIEHGLFALRFVDSWVDYPPTTIEPPHVIEVSATARPALFEKLRADRRVPFFIDARNAVSTYGFHAYWFDVRLLEVYPYLLGARTTRRRRRSTCSSKPSTAGNPTTTILVRCLACP